ncbi:Class II abasic (AP) endonuclease [Marasmius tenuissimus]|nr:Class II abasic (AP) endonuclease [Marasmius tenuissimus]
MRILTWNINGIRTIPQYHPWNTLKTHNDILDYLQADVINFQEVKSTRSALTKPVAVPPSYDSFFSFPVTKSGYSGVATYTRSSTVVPAKAEEGLSLASRSNAQVKPPLELSERVSKPESYPDSRVVIVAEEEDEVIDEDERNGVTLLLRHELKSLDAEGRVLTLDFGMFVLINVYCPNDGSEERFPFKMDFHYVLEDRVRALMREGREVVLVGDLNACAALIDHCEGNLIIKRGLAEGKDGETWFWEERDGRRWLRDLLIEEGVNGTGKEKACLVDIVRKFHPERKGMYTCWNTKLSARDSNYGTRIDYILVTPGLVAWIKDADIQPQIKGSDHCPVYVDFHDEIVNEDGVTLQLKDLLSGAGDMRVDPPRLAARYWDEYSGKQKLLSSFFGGKKAAAPSPSPTPTTTQVPVASTTVVSEQAGPSILTSEPLPATAGTQQPPREQAVSPTFDTSTPDLPLKASEPPNAAQSRSKRKRVSPKSSPVKAPKIQPSNKPAKKPKPGQSKLSTFFSQPGSSGSTSKAKGKGRSIPKTAFSQSITGYESEDVDMLLQESEPHENAEDLEDADYRLALELSSSQVSLSSPSSQKQKEAGDAWKSLMAPIQPPCCTVHNEVAKEFTVNKPGVNKGKRFFVCSRPVGPGYDKGRAERLREDVDPQYKCNFFKWSSDVRREMRQGG